MNFKNINNLFFVFLFLLLISCRSIDILKDKNPIQQIDNDDIQDISEHIKLNNQKNINVNIEDFYNTRKFNLLNDNKLMHIKTFKITKDKSINSKSLILKIYNKNIIIFTYDSVLQFYDINNFKLIKKIKLKSKFIDENFPTSIAYTNNNIIIAYSDGIIIAINYLGEVIWEKNYYDINKTPIKIVDQDILLLLSDKIISLDIKNGNLNWQHKYLSNNILQSSGGQITNINNQIFFILPNNKNGEIDIIFGEKNNSTFTNLNFINSINNSFDSIHSFENYISYFDQKKYITTINTINDNLILSKVNIKNVNSHFYFNNSLFILTNNFILKSYNIKNKNIFWKLNLTDIIKNKDKIINISNFNNHLFIFFANGIILKIDNKKGTILDIQKLEIKNIKNVYFSNNFIIFDHSHNKLSIYSQ